MKIAIAGYGIEGQASWRYYNNRGHDVTIIDQQDGIDTPEGAETILGADAFNQLEGFDIVVRTPALSPKDIKTDGKVWSATNEFFAHCPAPIIGVTGTKGKGTTCSLVASMLRAAGKTVHLVGNIGVPALDVLDTINSSDVVVFELSSFQLWDLEKSPQIAVVLMIEPDHLNVHENFDDYVVAKTNICKWQTASDVCFYHPSNEFSYQIAQAGEGQTKRFSIQDDGAAYVNENTFFIQDSALCDVNNLKLVGVHNQENACAAISATLSLDQSITGETIATGMRTFKGLPHRLKLIREIDGVKFYDDSYSSALGSTMAAIGAFDVPEVLLLGGSDKGISYDELGRKIANSPQVEHAILFGQTRKKIAESLQLAGVSDSLFTICTTTDFVEIIRTARSYARTGGVVILSPASASFDMFRNFSERGEQFIDIVSTL